MKLRANSVYSTDMAKIRLLSAVALILVTAMSVSARNDSVMMKSDRPLRPVTATVMVGVGSARLTHTYLSPVETSGFNTMVAVSRRQALRSNPRRWKGVMDIDLSLSNTHTVHTSSGAMWQAVLNGEFSGQYRFYLPYGIEIGAGPGLELSAGAAYRAANSNNPVAAQAAASVAAAASVSMPINFRKLNLTLSYHAFMPMAGAFFMPQYGQLYYEIYLGDTSGTVHFGWPGNRFAYHGLLSADFHFGSTTLRLGYDMRTLSSSANHLDHNFSSHNFVIGISTTRIAINPVEARRNKKIILP